LVTYVTPGLRFLKTLPRNVV